MLTTATEFQGAYLGAGAGSGTAGTRHLDPVGGPVGKTRQETPQTLEGRVVGLHLGAGRRFAAIASLAFPQPPKPPSASYSARPLPTNGAGTAVSSMSALGLVSKIWVLSWAGKGKCRVRAGQRPRQMRPAFLLALWVVMGDDGNLRTVARTRSFGYEQVPPDSRWWLELETPVRPRGPKQYPNTDIRHCGHGC